MGINLLDFGWHDAVGLTGVALLLLTYFALQIGKLDAKDLAYSVLNGISAVLILVSLLYTFNLASFVIEIFWLTISLIGVWRSLARRHRAADREQQTVDRG